MSDIYVLGGLLVGFVVIGPVVCWLVGMFNPIGYMLRPPWAPDVREARERERAQRRPILGPDGRLPDGTYLYGHHATFSSLRPCCQTDREGGHRGTCRHSMMRGATWDGDRP